MSDTKFTPAPWSHRTTGLHWNNPKLVNIEINYGDIQECVCDTVYRVEDAYLIAAAPELYDALERSIDMLQDYALDYKKISGSNKVHPTHKEIIDQAEKALAKARGE
jgi:hypothetical protein